MTAAVILAAGVGSRLRPLTDDRPKCLLSLGHETILGRMVRQLAAAGATSLTVATGYLAERVRESLAVAPLPCRFAHCPDYATTQNAVSLLRALEVAPDGPVLKLDGDLLIPDALLALALHGEGSKALVDDRAAPRAEAMKVRCEGDRALRFGKDLDPALCRGESIGVERFTREDRARITASLRRAVGRGETGLYYEECYGDAIDEGASLWVASIGDVPWTEVDDLADLERARRIVRDGL